MWVPGCVSGAGQTSSSPARISHNISPSPLGCGHSLWRGFPHISLSTAPSQVLPRNLGRWPPPEGWMFSARLAPTLSLISHVNQKSIERAQLQWWGILRIPLMMIMCEMPILNRLRGVTLSCCNNFILGWRPVCKIQGTLLLNTRHPLDGPHNHLRCIWQRYPSWKAFSHLGCPKILSMNF